jgi:tetratricopeptide (TPR) repeat protein
MLDRLDYVDAVLWLTARLADGLAHAHDRGILHCDLKPANVLLSDEGQPMLLDFNLAVDTARRIPGQGSVVGGTLPYMAPEHLELFLGGNRPVDARSDVYALGVILYELLTCRHPFHLRDGLLAALPAMVAERRQLPPVRRWNRAVTPAVEAIVHRCLAPDPARRYQSARQLLEDIERHRARRPLRHAPNRSVAERLRKWRRRHPALAAAGVVAAVAGVAVAALAALFAARGQDIERLEAAQDWQEFRTETRAAQLGIYARVGERDELVRGMAACRRALDRYHVLDDPDWRTRPAFARLSTEQQARVTEDIADLLLLSARGTLLLLPPDAAQDARSAAAAEALRLNKLAEECHADGAVPRALWEQRAQLREILGDDAEARRLRDQAAALPLRTARDHFWCGVDHFLAGRERAAAPLLEEAVRLDPQGFRAWFVLARCHDNAGRSADAAACYGTCIALEPGYVWAHFNRGLAHLKLQQFARARADFDGVIARRPDLADAYINRALAHRGLGKHRETVADLTTALGLGAPQTRVYFLRALAWDRLGPEGKEQAQADRAAGLRLEPTDEKSWIARALARKKLDPHGALADLDRALKLNPSSVSALQNRAHILADYMPVRHPTLLRAAVERLEQTRQAIAALDRALAVAPDYVPARSGRGVLYARLGQRSAALADARAVLQRDTAARTLYEVACIYALTARQDPDDRLEAFRLLAAALRSGFGHDLIERDDDLAALRPYAEFRRLVDGARALRPTRVQG